jgi:hypothetical protein
MWREFIIICEHVALYHVRLVSREVKSPLGPALAHGVIVAHDWRQLGLAPAAAAGQCHASHFGTTALLLCCQSRLKLPQAHVRRAPLVDATPVLGHDGQACKNLFERVAQLDERAKGDPLLQNSFIPGFVSTEGELDYGHSSQVSSSSKGSLITVTIAIQKAINMPFRIPSVRHQTVISEASVGHQHAIKGASPWDPSRRAEARRARTERAPSRC